MKKITLLALLVVAMMVVATAAYAISPAYITWVAGGPNAGTNGPHQNYQLATEKCAVCHAVHGAAATDAVAGHFGPDAITDDTELLLRTSVANACTYCHITSTVAGLQIYGGVASYYTTDDQYGHNGSSSAECADCHSVHGADTFKGYIAGKILKANGNAVANTSGSVQTEADATLDALVSAGTSVFDATAVSVGNVGDVQVTAFCTRCHKTFSDASEDTITASGYFHFEDDTITYGAVSYKNHPLKAASTEGAGLNEFYAKGANTTQTVAWASAATCRACHAAGDTRVSTSYGGTGGLVTWSFPHYTPGNAQFLPAGVSTTDTAIGILDDHSSATGKPAGSNVVDNGSIDGACLRCHVQNATSGVGMTF